MEEYLHIIQKSLLFHGLTAPEALSVLNCLSARQTAYPKNNFIMYSGDTVRDFGIVLSGSVNIIKEDFWGNRNILSLVIPGQLFAETYAASPNVPLGVSVTAAEPSVILWLDMQRLLTACSSVCSFHTKLIHNLLSILAEKNLMMNEKLTHITKRSTRDKLLSYLSAESKRQGSSSFQIAFNRQQLADYLSVDRSAMSNELSKMQAEGLLLFHKNCFTLKSQQYPALP